MEKIRSIRAKPNDGVLFLQGVFKKDYKRMEDIFQDRLLVEQPAEVKTYDKLPVNFTTLADWPKSVNLKCWWCHMGFKGRPWFEPQSIEPINTNDSHGIKSTKPVKKQISVPPRGVFCTANCASAYIRGHTKDLAECHNRIAMLKYIYEIFTGKKIPDIQPSPPPTEMLCYGGHLSENEYRQKIDSLDAAYLRELEDGNFSNICQLYAGKLMD